MQAGCYGERLGRVTLDISDEAVRVADVRHEVASDDWPTDPAVLDELAACERDLAVWLAEPVAVLEDAVPWQELNDSAVARLVAESLLAAHPGDVGMLIAGHCVTGLPAGKVTRGDTWAATSSPGNAATGSVPGTVLRALALKGVSEEYTTTCTRLPDLSRELDGCGRHRRFTIACGPCVAASLRCHSAGWTCLDGNPGRRRD